MIRFARTFFSFVVVFSLSAVLGAQDSGLIGIDELENYIDLNTSLVELYEFIENGREIPSDRYYLIPGTVTSISTLDPNPETFYSEVEFSSARWIGQQEIQSYDSLLVFLDPSFASRLPQRSPRNPPENIIEKNSRGMAVAEYYDILEMPDGSIIPVFIAHIFRNLE